MWLAEVIVILVLYHLAIPPRLRWLIKSKVRSSKTQRSSKLENKSKRIKKRRHRRRVCSKLVVNQNNQTLKSSTPQRFPQNTGHRVNLAGTIPKTPSRHDLLNQTPSHASPSGLQKPRSPSSLSQPTTLNLIFANTSCLTTAREGKTSASFLTKRSCSHASGSTPPENVTRQRIVGFLIIFSTIERYRSS